MSCKRSDAPNFLLCPAALVLLPACSRCVLLATGASNKLDNPFFYVPKAIGT